MITQEPRLKCGENFFIFVSFGFKEMLNNGDPLFGVKYSFSPKSQQLPRSRIHERTILLSFLGIILRVLRLDVSYTIFTLQASFKPLLLKVGE
jgi:hypothetical protein